MRKLSERARSHYIDSLPYHDWRHAEDVMRIVANIADMSIDPDIRANKQLLVIAAAWHDADYHIEDLGAYGTKERRSADLIARMLPELSHAEHELIASAIIDTTVELHPKASMFGEVLHAADVGYFADDTERFMERLRLMREEWGSPDWTTTVERTIGFGKSVIAEAERLMPKILAKEHADAWIARIEHNLNYLESELRNGRLSD